MKATTLFAASALAFTALVIPPRSHAGDGKIWHVKAIHPEGLLLDVKAFDSADKPIAIKAIQVEGNTSLLDIKALHGEKMLAVKVLPKAAGDVYFPVKAIAEDGTIYPIKALTASGKKLDVKGVGERGNVFAIKAVAEDGKLYGIKAVSPEGRVYDVKGVKTSDGAVEGKVGSVEITAHIKGLPQAP